jgi:predicted DNA-binding protein with PD1-like motif
MTVRVHRSERARHLVLRLSAGEMLPDSLDATLREEQVTCGWMRASGILADIEIRAFDPELGGLGRSRRIAGPVHVVALEGGMGLAQGEPSVSLRALIAREGDRGLETLAGEIVSARVVALEAFVTVLDDVTIERGLDPSAGVWLFGASGVAAGGGGGGAGPARPVRHAPQPPNRPQAPTAWSSALEASEEPAPEPAPVRSTSNRSGGGGGTAVPQRPPRPTPDLDAIVPEAGDSVDHFAFGRCDVVRSDGDRLHLKVHKDGRIREIALEMLRVTRLEDSGAKRRFKLERRM